MYGIQVSLSLTINWRSRKNIILFLQSVFLLTFTFSSPFSPNCCNPLWLSFTVHLIYMIEFGSWPLKNNFILKVKKKIDYFSESFRWTIRSGSQVKYLPPVCIGDLISTYPHCYAFQMIFTKLSPRPIQSISRNVNNKDGALKPLCSTLIWEKCYRQIQRVKNFV